MQSCHSVINPKTLTPPPPYYVGCCQLQVALVSWLPSLEEADGDSIKLKQIPVFIVGMCVQNHERIFKLLFASDHSSR